MLLFCIVASIDTKMEVMRNSAWDKAADQFEESSKVKIQAAIEVLVARFRAKYLAAYKTPDSQENAISRMETTVSMLMDDLSTFMRCQGSDATKLLRIMRSEIRLATLELDDYKQLWIVFTRDGFRAVLHHNRSYTEQPQRQVNCEIDLDVVASLIYEHADINPGQLMKLLTDELNSLASTR